MKGNCEMKKFQFKVNKSDGVTLILEVTANDIITARDKAHEMCCKAGCGFAGRVE